MGFQAFDERVAGNWQVVFDDTTYPTPSGLNGQNNQAIRFDTIVATNSDTVDHVLGFAFDLGAGYAHFGQCNVPAGAGDPGVPSVDVLAAILPVTTQGIVVQPMAVFAAAQYDALGSGKKIVVTAIGGYI